MIRLLNHILGTINTFRHFTNGRPVRAYLIEPERHSGMGPISVIAEDALAAVQNARPFARGHVGVSVLTTGESFLVYRRDVVGPWEISGYARGS